MNNEQFRKLIAANAASPSDSKNGPSPPSASASGGAALGRAVGNAQADFARQVAERNQALRPQKKHKTSVPKGAKLAAGYVDRAQQRQDEVEDDREAQLKALDLALKGGEIDRETYDKRRFDIAGGSLDSTHLVKGLDFKLLERIRKGEDVYGNKANKEQQNDEEPAEDDIDDAFDDLAEKEVHAVEREKTQKKGQFSTVALEPGKKRTRNQILAELKAAREAAKAQQQSSLGSKFKRIGGVKQKPGTRIERDAKGREVLIIVDEDGNEKRKVRKLQAADEEAPPEPEQDLPMPDPKAKPLGMEVPEHYRKKEMPEEDKDVDIFDDIGDDYDPLAGMDGSESDSGDSDEDKPTAEDSKEGSKATDAARMPPPPRPAPPAAARNYFKNSKTGLLSEEAAKGPSMSDAEMMAAIKRAAALRPIEGEEDAKAKEAARAMEERRKKLLQNSARDDEDLDMGFGTSRFEDEEDFDDDKVKLSTWGAEGGDGGDDGARGGQKRKRGPKKRKGDANNAEDVLRVMEQRKKK
ncbi:RED-like protein [Purpureocillium lavendulum]|uniref:RED-like protein n=1 Tax=Purpureocillium lavendulum TaxID=1247861 RepID=A0AB34G362_9HYPO|nr:RED-like protein [Purpureocillium lavendulum]